MKHPTKLLAASALLSVLAGCSTTDGRMGKLKPTVPTQAGGSIAKAANKLKDADCPETPESDKALCQAKPFGLDHVKRAFDDLYTGTRGLSDNKNEQEWAYGELAATGGFGAVVGQLASQTGLLNSGIALATVGLSMDSFYKPGTTKATHLRAEAMFQCLQRELSYVTEDERATGEKADVADGATQAASAVRDAVEQIDSAITSYRQSVLTQTVSLPSSADFSSFAKRYAAAATESASATLLAANAASAAPQAAAADANAISKAKAKVAAAKFVALQVNLEKCVKVPGS